VPRETSDAMHVAERPVELQLMWFSCFVIFANRKCRSRLTLRKEGQAELSRETPNGLSAARYCETCPDTVNNFPNGRLFFCSFEPSLKDNEPSWFKSNSTVYRGLRYGQKWSRSPSERSRGFGLRLLPCVLDRETSRHEFQRSTV
jgi:hypothetical protein